MQKRFKVFYLVLFMNNFEIEKNNALRKKDKSNEGVWDLRIRVLCDLINEKKDYFTTSSCSGRICLVRGLNKVSNIFVYKSHDLVEFKEINDVINECEVENVVYFRQEPCALHVACNSLESASRLVDLARKAGWKRSGIFSFNNDKFICELVSTEWIVAPVVKDKKVIVKKDYLSLLVEEANKKLERCWKKIKSFESVI